MPQFDLDPPNPGPKPSDMIGGFYLHPRADRPFTCAFIYLLSVAVGPPYYPDLLTLDARCYGLAIARWEVGSEEEGARMPGLVRLFQAIDEIPVESRPAELIQRHEQQYWQSKAWDQLDGTAQVAVLEARRCMFFDYRHHDPAYDYVNYLTDEVARRGGWVGRKPRWKLHH